MTLASQDAPAKQGRPCPQHVRAHAGLAKAGGGAPPRAPGPAAPPVVGVEPTGGPVQASGRSAFGRAAPGRTREWEWAVGLDIYAIRVRGPKPWTTTFREMCDPPQSQRSYHAQYKTTQNGNGILFNCPGDVRSDICILWEEKEEL